MTRRGRGLRHAPPHLTPGAYPAGAADVALVTAPLRAAPRSAGALRSITSLEASKTIGFDR